MIVQIVLYSVFTEPSPPRNVEVQLINSTAIEIKWSPPAEPNGPLAVYLVSLSPPLPPVTKTVLAAQTSAIIKFPFEERRYTLWVSEISMQLVCNLIYKFPKMFGNTQIFLQFGRYSTILQIFPAVKYHKKVPRMITLQKYAGSPDH